MPVLAKRVSKQLSESEKVEMRATLGASAYGSTSETETKCASKKDSENRKKDGKYFY